MGFASLASAVGARNPCAAPDADDPAAVGGTLRRVYATLPILGRQRGHGHRDVGEATFFQPGLVNELVFYQEGSSGRCLGMRNASRCLRKCLIQRQVDITYILGLVRGDWAPQEKQSAAKSGHFLRLHCEALADEWGAGFVNVNDMAVAGDS